ncbi:MAG: hypothetical protein D6706_12480 [Chloroflexi bacterium]|nr:MAG: hypothetical protein D6706_12480 [Chloroflexota bacterium]
MGWRLFWLGGVLTGLGVYDLFWQPVFGDGWYLLWLADGVVWGLWFYYVVLMRRAAVQVRRHVLRLQGPLVGMNVSYGRIASATSTHIAQHYPRKN